MTARRRLALTSQKTRPLEAPQRSARRSFGPLVAVATSSTVQSYLITGGAGFIGSHLADRLVARGKHVVVLDDLSTGRRDNVAALTARRRFRLVVGSANNAALVDELVRSCDVVVHLAAAVGVELIRRQPLRSALTNTTTTTTVLDAAARHGKRVLIASSSEVYGYGAPVPVAETAERVLGAAGDMRTSYAASKALEESMALAWAYEHGLPVVVARLFNTAGPRQRFDYGMVLPRFVRRALTGRPLRVLGDGGQSRSFSHVLDVVEALQRLIESPGAACDVFNVGRSEEVTVLQLAERVMEATGTTGPVELVPYPHGFREARRRVPDVTKIRNCIGWTATRDLDSIIHDVIAEHAVRPPAAAAP